MAVISTPQDLKTIVMELLREFKIATNGKKPEKIIFYRDGVSEGQFETVQRLEIPQVRARVLGSSIAAMSCGVARKQLRYVQRLRLS